MYLFDSIFDMSNYFNIHFNPSGVFNNKNSWISDDSKIKIIWDTTLNAWKLSGSTLGNVQVINTNPAYPPINNNWKVLGSTHVVKSATQGACPPIIMALTYNYDSNNPGCKCDGSINITATGGVPPYQYSYNEGVTYISSPIKTGLCGGTYITSVKDSVGTVVQDGVVTLSAVKPTTEYKVYFNNNGAEQLTTNSFKYTISVVTSPKLPPGVTLTMDVVLGGLFFRTPYSNSANSSLVPQITKNGVVINNFTNETNETTSLSTNSRCQGNTIYMTNYSYKYPSISITSTDVLNISIVTDYNLTCNNQPPVDPNLQELGENGFSEIGPLTMGREAFAQNICCNAGFNSIIQGAEKGTISGCDCCTVTGYVTKSLYE